MTYILLDLILIVALIFWAHYFPRGDEMEFIDTLGHLARPLTEFAAELRQHGHGLFVATGDAGHNYLQPLYGCFLEERFVRFEARTALRAAYGSSHWEPVEMPAASSHDAETEVFAENRWTLRLGRVIPGAQRLQLVVLPFERLPQDFAQLEAYIHGKAIQASGAPAIQ